MAFSNIEWTDHTFNPWIGCQHISPGCDHCYAETQNNFGKWNGGEWGPRAPRKRTSDQNWRKPIKWNAEAEASGERYKVFCASLADWLDNKAPEGAREDLAELIEATPNLNWLLLTKRVENFRKLSPWSSELAANVWLGVTAENQEYFDRRRSILQKIEASVSFISHEPPLGPLSIGGHDLLPD
jgi:protein gp37